MKHYAFFILFTAILLGGTGHAQVPPLVNYQGWVTVDSVNFEGVGQFKFALVNGEGTTTFWSNDGTSAAGSEPVTAVTLTVAKGLYSVLLGDIKLGNMTTLPPSAFANPDVRLRVWFDDGLNGSQLLSPDQRLAPSAYLADGTVTSASLGESAVTAGKIAPGAVSGGNLAPASVTWGNLLTLGPPVPGQVLGFNNGELTWTAPGGGVFSLNGTSAYYNGGNVGVGTFAPATTLEANGPVRSTRAEVAPQYVQLNGGDSGAIKLTAQSNAGAEKNLLFENFSGDAMPGASNAIQFVLGTAAAPSTKMTIDSAGTVTLPLSGSGGGMFLGTPNGETGISIRGTNRAEMRFDNSTLKFVAGPGTGPPAATNGLAVTTAGNVGIGTTAPVAKLHAQTAVPNTAAVYGFATASGGVGVYGQSNSGPAVHAQGNATQARDQGGFVKAMAYVNPFLPADQYIVRCYNSQQTGSAMSTPPCGMTMTRFAPGWYVCDFGFGVNDRFISITVDNSGIENVLTVATVQPNGSTNETVLIADLDGGGRDRAFFIFVY